LGLRPRPRWGELSALLRPSSWILGVLLLRGGMREGNRRGGKGRGKKEKGERGKNGEE